MPQILYKPALMISLINLSSCWVSNVEIQWFVYKIGKSIMRCSAEQMSPIGEIMILSLSRSTIPMRVLQSLGFWIWPIMHTKAFRLSRLCQPKVLMCTEAKTSSLVDSCGVMVKCKKGKSIHLKWIEINQISKWILGV